MRQRVTYVHGHEDDFHPDKIKVENISVTITSLKASKEHRITFASSELPQEISTVLKQCHEIHIRWASQSPYVTVAPFVSRIPPGLHVFFTGQRGSDSKLLCASLRKIFSNDLKCESPKKTFSSLPILSERFSMSASSQYFQPLPSLQYLVEFIQNKICPTSSESDCHDRVHALYEASYLDIDFDTISHSLIFNAYWATAPTGEAWNEKIEITTYSNSIEIGVLNNERPDEPEEQKLGGLLTVIGEDTKPSTTLFSFPARHHALPVGFSEQSYIARFLQPTGLHPTLDVSFPYRSLKSPSDSCALHIYFTLPSCLFIDRYQLSDPLFLASKNLTSLRSLSGETDLEAPDWVVSKWGSAALVEVAQPPRSGSFRSTRLAPQDRWTVQVPLHARYLPPISGGRAPVTVPWPVVFWACPAEGGHKMSVNPFDRVNLGYDGLFGPRTMFYHVPPSGSITDGGGQGTPAEPMLSVDTPVLDISQAWYIETGSVATVLMGFLWICWSLAATVHWHRLVGRARQRSGRKRA